METLHTECTNTIPVHVENMLNNLKNKSTNVQEPLPIKHVPEPITPKNITETKLGKEVIAEMETKKISNLLKEFIILMMIKKIIH